MDFLLNNWQELVLAFTSIVTGASIIVKLTPTESDDKVVNTILRVLQAIALNKRA